MYMHSKKPSVYEDDFDSGVVTHEEDGLVFTFTETEPAVNVASNILITSEDNDLEQLLQFQHSLKTSMMGQLIIANLCRRAGVTMKTIDVYLHMDMCGGDHSISLVGGALRTDEFTNIIPAGSTQPEGNQEFSTERIGTIAGIPVMIKQTIRRAIGQLCGVISFQVSLLSPNHSMFDISYSDITMYVLNHGLEEYSQKVYGGFMPYTSSFNTLNTMISMIHIDNTIFSCDVMVQCKLIHIGGVAHSMVIDNALMMIGTVLQPDVPNLPHKQDTFQMVTSSDICQTILSYQPSALGTVYKNGNIMNRRCCTKDHYVTTQASMVLPKSIVDDGDERVHTCKLVGTATAALWLPYSITFVEIAKYEFHRVYAFINISKSYGEFDFTNYSLNAFRVYLRENGCDNELYDPFFKLLNDHDDVSITPVYITVDTRRYMVSLKVNPNDRPELLKNTQGAVREFCTNSPYDYELNIDKYYDDYSDDDVSDTNETETDIPQEVERVVEESKK